MDTEGERPRIDPTMARDKIVRFRSGVAAAYDAGPSGGISTEAEHRAWPGILGDLLPPVPSDLLDTGTGPGVMAFLASELGYQATSADPDEEMLAMARGRPSLVPPLVGPRFAPGSFDTFRSCFVATMAGLRPSPHLGIGRVATQ